jgi:hypothetical protein
VAVVAQRYRERRHSFHNPFHGFERFCSIYSFELEPPIGIEPMTYALRGGLQSSEAVHQPHLGLVALYFIAADSSRIQARPRSLLALALAGFY